jgi:pyroglutamyl-peptidase
VLLTGFGPFPGMPVNPSQLVVERLAEIWNAPSIELKTVVLPTEYGRSAEAIKALLQEWRPKACICLGVAPTPGLRLECVARNAITSTTADATGQVPIGEIYPDAPALYQSTLPLGSLRLALAQLGLPVRLSFDAGGYVCNHTFYTARHQTAALELNCACGFVHIPLPDNAGYSGAAAGLTLDQLESAVRCCVCVTAMCCTA